MTDDKEFRFLGLTMVNLTVLYGAFLVAVAIVSSIGSTSITSWIPAMIGGPILVSGILAAVAPAQKKTWMHVAVLFGLLAFLGGFRFFAGFFADAGVFGKPKAAVAQLLLLVTGGIYTRACVKSFIHARRTREAAEAVES